jgi:transposase-like protein
MGYKCSNCGHEEGLEKTTDYQNKEWLFEQYVTKRRSMQSIATQCGVSSMTINNWLLRFDIKTRGRGVRSGLFDI